MVTDCADMYTIRLRKGSKNLGVNDKLPRLRYHDLYLGGKALVDRENVDFELTKFDLCPSFIEDLTAKGVDLFSFRAPRGGLQAEGHGTSSIQPIECDVYIYGCIAFDFNVKSWEGSFFFIENKIVSSEYPELLLEYNKLEKNAAGEKQLMLRLQLLNDTTARRSFYYVIKNGNSFKPVAQTTTNADGTSTSLTPGPVTIKEKAQKKNDVKARSMLLMALPNEHLMTFNQYKDAKTLCAAHTTRFGVNERTTKNTRKTLLKQMYENFSAPSTEYFDSIFNRLQKIISQLAILGENISHEDLNLKFLRSLPSDTHVMVWRNKPDLDIMSFNNLYNNFKIVEQEVKGTASSSSSSSSQNMDFVSSPSSTNEVNTAYGVSTANTHQPNGSQLVYEDLEQIHEDDIEEIDLKWKLALLSMRTRRFFQKTGRKITINWSATDSRNRNQDNSRKTVNVEETSSKAMVSIDGAGFDWSYMTDNEVPTNMALMTFLDSEIHNDKTCSKTCLKSFETLKTQLDDLRIEFNKSKFNLATYKRGLAYVEEQLVFYKKNEANYNYHQRERVVSGNNYTRVNYNYSTKKAHPSTHKNMAPRAVLMKSGLRPLNTARPVNTAHHKSTVYSARPMSRFSKPAQSTGHPQKKDQGYVDSGRSRHMTGNMSYLSDFKEFDGGYVTFGGGAKGGRITGKGTLKTVVAGTNSNDSLGTKESAGTCHSTKETRSSQDYILMPLWKDGLLFDSSSKNARNDEPQPSNDAGKKDDEGGIDDQERPKKSAQDVNTAGLSINTASTNFNTGSLNINTVSPTVTTVPLETTHDDFFVGKENLNKVLVVKPYNKTLYELFRGRTPALSFMRPFGCHVTILNTLEYYASLMEVRWKRILFDTIEKVRLLKCTKESICAGHSSKETGSSQDYILMPLCKDGSLFDSSLKNASNDEPQPSSDAGKKDGEDIFSLGDNATLEATHANFFGDETEVDMSNITTTYPVPSTPNIRIHKGHSLDHVIGRAQKGNPSIKRSKLDKSYAISASAVQVTIGLDLVDLPLGKRAISTKWVYRNKKDERARTPYQNSVAERRNKTLIRVARTMLADSKLPTIFWAEADNTACYVHNRVLVVKPHKKTPYELFRGRTPSLSFTRPFGCHVTILNTLDYLGKFYGKSDEGFFVGYSMNSKAFRVYDIRTRKVEENLHIRFLEDKPIIAGDGPKWLFNIDVLTKLMNYLPVIAGTNSNDLVGTEESIGACHFSKEIGSSQDYILMPLDTKKKDNEGVCKESGIADQEKLENSTQGVNTAESSINTEPDMFSLEDNVTATHADFFGDETEVDMSNITTTYPVPSTPNTRIHKDHSLDHVIGDIQSGVLTRKMTKTTNEQGFISAIYEGKTYEDLHTSIQEELLQFKIQQGYTQEEGIYYDEVLAPVARIEAIRLFLVYASFKDFVVYQMDVKSTFLYGKIEEEVYMSSMGELTLFLELQVTHKDDGIFISQDKYVDEILKKFGFSTVKTTSTPMETSKPLLKDAEAEDVYVHLYRLMIGLLMYLTSSRPDIMFVVCACARFQVTPKVLHLHAVKRIFKYLKGQPKLGLWYPKDSPFDLEAYSDSDYASASLDRKSTIGGCQFLGSRLISWQCKKQTIVANFTTKAEYVAAASCYGQATAKEKSVNGEVQIQALVDGKKVIVTETSVRRTLQLKDVEGTECLPNATIFVELEKIGAKTTAWNEFSRTMAFAIILFLNKQVEGMTKHKEIYVTPSHTKKVFTNMKREEKGFSGRVTPLFETMMLQAPEELEPITDEDANKEHVPVHSNDPLLKIAKLKEKVKKLQRRSKSRTLGLKRLKKVGRTARIESSEDEGLGAQEDASKQGRKIADLDADVEEVEVEKVVSTAEVTTAIATTTIVDELTLAQTLIEIKAAKPKAVTTAATTTTTTVTRPKARGVVV
ncbi:retrovirus-related pol polyprotein from transposon TNT 1-94 [Tanacetum coccineum]